MGKKKGKNGTKGKRKSKYVTRTPVQNGEYGGDTAEPEDFEYYQNTGRNLEFLTELTAGSCTKIQNEKLCKKRKHNKTTSDEEEADYEKRPRTSQDDTMDDQHILLPIKSKQGVIQRLEQKNVVAQDEPQNNITGDDNNSSETKETPTPPPVLSVVELFARRQQKLAERKILIAELSNRIIENPEENISQLKELCFYCEEKDVDIRITTRKLAMLSLLTVFKDIVPGYHLRLPTEKEKEVKVSKDVRRLRDHEEGLLLTYQKYLQILEETAQGKSKKEKKKNHVNGSFHKDPSESLVLTAIQCLCDLLISLLHFNYHTNLIAMLVPRMDDESHGRQISELCCETFHSLFKQDSTGDVSLEVVKLISKHVKTKGYRVKPCVLQVFLSLRINEMDILSLRDSKDSRPEKVKGKNKIEKMLKGKMSKKDRKRQKEMKQLDKELQETQAVESHQRRAKTQTEILKFVFVTYFRVLKNTRQSPLLSPVLEGLAKHAHLINVDFFADLMTALQSVSSQELSLRETLNCVLTAFKILTGQGEALNIDPRGFYCTLYNALLQLHAGASNDDVNIALKCLDVMMQKRRKQVPLQRVSAFVKRLSTLCLHVMPNSTLALLALVRTFFQIHPRCQTLLDSETLGTGVFRPDVEDPELSNTDSTTSWELSYLTTRHYHPTVRTFAAHIVTGAANKGTGSQLGRIQPEEFYRSYDASEMKLNPELLETTPSRNTSKRRLSVLDEASWNDSCISSAIKSAMDFTDDTLKKVKFTLPATAFR